MAGRNATHSTSPSDARHLARRQQLRAPLLSKQITHPDDPTPQAAECERVAAPPVRDSSGYEVQDQRARRVDERRRITDALLGVGLHPADFPAVVRKLHSEVQYVHDLLTGRGWQLDTTELEHGDVLWSNPRATADVPADADLSSMTTIRFTPPATAHDRRTYVVNIAGKPHNDGRTTLGETLRSL